MICMPMRSKRSMSFFSVSSSSSLGTRPRRSSGSGPMPATPTIEATRVVALWRSPPTPFVFSP